MTADDPFWRRCIDAHCVVLAVQVYSDWGADDNIDPNKCLGVRFAAFPFDEQAVGPDYWFMIEESQCGIENLYETPIEAVDAFEKDQQERERLRLLQRPRCNHE